MKKSIQSLLALVGCVVAGCGPAIACAPIATPTPEPSTILLVTGAGGALLLIRRFRNRK